MGWKSSRLLQEFWGDFGGNAFSDGLIASVNSERMSYAREMLSGRQPPRDDIPCTTWEMYQAMRDRSRFIDRDPMPQASDQGRCENVRREIETLLTEVDTELADLDKDQDDFVRALDSLSSA